MPTKRKPLARVAEAEHARELMDAMTVTMNGDLASSNYFYRRRATLYNVFKYAVTRKHLAANPLAAQDLGWEKPDRLEIDHTLDPRSVGNTDQVEAMLNAVSYVGRRRGPRLVAFYGCVYYAMMRPSEVIDLKRSQCHLPDEGWGTLVLEGAAPDVGKAWTDTGTCHDIRGLKRRSAKATRPIPIPPRLVAVLKEHIARFGTAADGRLFRTATGNRISSETASTRSGSSPATTVSTGPIGTRRASSGSTTCGTPGSPCAAPQVCPPGRSPNGQGTRSKSSNGSIPRSSKASTTAGLRKWTTSSSQPVKRRRLPRGSTSLKCSVLAGQTLWKARFPKPCVAGSNPAGGTIFLHSGDIAPHPQRPVGDLSCPDCETFGESTESSSELIDAPRWRPHTFA